jgi:chemotaxis protein CheX
MEFREAELGQFVAGIWQGQLGLDVQPGDPQAAHGMVSWLTGSVRIAGPWRGAVVLACSVPLAQRAAAIMFGVAPQAVTVEQTQDAVSELTNIIGGNIKPLLAPGAYLSTPVVGDGDPMTVPAGRPLVQMAFESEAQPFQIAVFEQNDG